MLTEIIGKNIEITDAMRDITEKKIGKLNKYVILGDNARARVLARTYRNQQKIEITIWSAVGILRSEVMASDYYEALDLAVDKIAGQIRKQKTRLVSRHKENVGKTLYEEAEKAEADHEIHIKTKELTIEALSIDDAILQMELLNHSFFAFLDEETNRPSVVYRRHDNTYGLLELRF